MSGNSSMDKAIFISKRMVFNRKHSAFKDMVMAHMAIDIERAIKTTAGTPVKTGGLKSEVRSFKSRSDQYKVESNKEYSAYQERGARQDGSHRVQHYTTAGTSAGWFARAVDRVIRNKNSYVKEAKRALNL